MENAALAFLSHDWAGLCFSALFLIAGGSSWRLGRGRHRKLRVAGALLLGIGSMMAAGATYHLVYMIGVRNEHPAPGKLVDIGGYRLHVLAEGKAHGKPAIVWMPGAHSAGFYFHHLHRALRGETRSILVDRPGMGWSDIGPFPRTTPLEAEEVVEALRRAGERGPFILVGHSFGGLLVANIARRHPDLAAAVVLLDATPPDAINYAPSNPFLRQMRVDALLATVQRLFGIHSRTAERLWGRETALDAQRIESLVEERIGKPLHDVRAIEEGARANAANFSIFAELAPGRLSWDAVVYDGELGDVPVYLVAPQEMPELGGASQRMMREEGENSLQSRDMRRLQRFYARARERYMAVSSRAQRIVTPSGTGHNYPYEAPQFVVDALRQVLRDTPSRLDVAAFSAPPPATPAATASPARSAPDSSPPPTGSAPYSRHPR